MTTERLALLPLTGAGETTCDKCHHRVLDVCDIHGRLLSDHGKPYERFALCIRSERDAARLRAVEVAARAYAEADDAAQAAVVEDSLCYGADTEAAMKAANEALAALCAALKE